MTTPATPADYIVATLTAALAGTGLHLEHRRHELIITNPADPERGQICITLDDGYITWERTVTSYWGQLPGLPTPDQDTPTVPVSKIIDTLTGRM